jgi:hypothetical protein
MTAAAVAAPPDLIALYRDDGPIARALGGALPAAVRVPGVVLIVAGLAPLLAAAAIGGVSRGVAAAVLAWAVLLAGASTSRPSSPKSRWAESPLIRLTEYGALLWIASLEGESAYPAAFALLAALTFRHYDLAYRLRHLGTTPARWLGMGWDGRLVAGFALLLAGALPAGFFVAAGLLGVAFAGESAAAWLAAGRARRGAMEPAAADEGDEL